MNKVKITVLKTTLDRELAAEYGAEGLTACPMLKEGQIFYADYAKPEGFCDEAWKAIYQCFRTCARCGNGRFLLRRLDPHSGRRNLQLQRRAASCYFQAGGYRPKIGAGLCAGPVNVSQKRSPAIFGLYFYKAYAIITRSK